MAFKLVIGDAGSELTFTEAGKVRYGFIRALNASGQVDSVEHSLLFTGILTTTPAPSVKSLIDRFTTTFSQTPVQFIDLSNPSNIVDMQPSAGFVGPFVTRFELVDDDGALTSHARFEIEIFWRSKGSNADVYEFVTSIEIVKDLKGNRVVRKVWTASARASSASKAKAKCLTVKPSATDLIESIKTSKENASCEASWVWEAKRIFWVEETVDFDPGFPDWTPVPRAEKENFPVLHMARNKESTLTIVGTVYGYSPEDCVQPAPHCEEGDDLKPLRNYNLPNKVEVHNPELGIYRLRFREVWLASGVTPVINHHGHDVITFIDAPGDGSAAP